MTWQTWIAAVLGASAGASVLVAGSLETGKRILPKLFEGREKLVALAASLAVGIVASISARIGAPDQFPGGWKGWAIAVGSGLAVGLFSTAGSGGLHDKILSLKGGSK